MTDPTHHAIDHVELTVTDLEAAKRFRTGAFDWEFTDYGPQYPGIQGPGGSGEVGGLRLDATPPGAGGPLVVQGPYEFPGGRRFHFADPSGNELGVWSTA